MTKYVKREMNDLHGTGEKKLYYAIPLNRNMSYEEVLEWMRENHFGLTVGIAANALQAAASTLAALMSMGYSVTLGGIGTFRPRLGLTEGAEPEQLETDDEARNAQSLRVSGVSFKPDRRLVEATDRRCRLESGGVVRLHETSTTLEERMEMAADYLRDHVFMHVGDYARLTGLSVSTAARELKAVRGREYSPIDSVGRGTHRLYVLSEEAR